MESQDIISDKDLLRINVESVEKHIITSVLKRTNGNQTEAAKQLGTTKRKLNYRVHKYHIDTDQFRSSHS